MEPREGLGNTAEEALLYLRVIGRCGSFVQAARSLDIKPTRLRRVLSQLEAQVGQPLLCYQNSAVELTPKGREWQALQGVKGRECPRPASAMGWQPIRLVLMEELLHDIFLRELLNHLRRSARLNLEIVELRGASMEALQQADIAVWLSDDDRPQEPPDMRTQWLAGVHYQAHVSKRYSRKQSRPASSLELSDFQLVQSRAYLHSQSLMPWNNYVAARESGVVVVRSHELLLQTLRWGACVGLLPHYASRLDRTLVGLGDLFEAPMRRNMFLSVSDRRRQGAGVQEVLEVLCSAFESRREWFA
ncbi:LysR family transcriptional regulator [Pseudomonas sp. 148P]|uniref:LysR family transcriptional regulator n=1 Tax=Pseudomonas ulcerans TaxID=3115852 RepID=A0ABU7HL91_9PSED|nr:MULTISPECIES: LysR family transcriptional regulator [unclassified Pseudomonas]MEE1920833.1 LysR family transcriptional regulator [Pseudomonas sp. 147P]MEE1932266.1 LysR family transcriptional regulator [Pseudomonas sp. 148P]